MDTLLQDLRYAVRTLAKSPGFALAAVLTLALGIGANTAVFSAANALLLRPPPGSEPGRLVRVYRGSHSPLSPGELRYVREHNRTLEGLFGERRAVVALNTARGNERAVVELVNGNYFTLLGVPAARGRVFTPAEDSVPGVSPVAVLSHRWWKARFGADPAVVGRTIRLNGRAYTVVGVAPEHFSGTFPGFSAHAWLPMSELKPLTGMDFEDAGSLYAMGRLKPGATRDAAAADLKVLAGQLTAADPRLRRPVTLTVDHARGVNAELRPQAAGVAGGLLFVTLLVLLIACTNVANLMLARATARRREIGIRLAIGASRRRLVRQLLTESVLLALVGGVLALLIVTWLADLAAALVPATSEVALDFSPDRRVLFFALGASLFAGVLFGLLPALRASAPDVTSSLKEDSAAPRRSRMRGALVGAQVALCMVLLAGAALFLRSLGNARRIDPGFDPAPLLNTRIDLRLGRYDGTTGPAFYRRLLGELAAVPGVESAALQQVPPLQGENRETSFVTEGQGPDEERRITNFDAVSPGFFHTIGIPVLGGREFAASDGETAPAVAVVNQTFARRHFPGGQALGKRVSMEGAEGPWVTIVGVVRDAKYVTLGEDPRPMLYLPFAQNYDAEAVVYVRAAGDPAALAKPVHRAAQALDPVLPIPEPVPVRESLRFALAPARVGAWVLGVFGALALSLAAVGIYGVVSYAVSQRTREIGIRSALGAGPARVVRMVLGDNLRVVAAGLGAGLALAVPLGMAAAGFLYGVSPADPAVLLGTPLVLAAVALLASWAPARRAARVDPMVALRAE
ncbi:MAG TPA: ABC transporter permease [Longimicrobium sp.]|jgi:predicted permease